MRAVCWAVCLSVTLAGAVSAQAPAAEPAREGFSETLEVQGVNVEAVVTDKQGRRVPGLTARDFRLLVDGKPVHVDFFLEVREGRAAQTARLPGAAGEPEVATLEAGEAVPTNYLVFIDDYFSPLTLRNEVLKSLSRELRSLGARDRVAVVAFDGRGSRVLSSWAPASEGLEHLLGQAGRQKRFLTRADLDLNTGPLPVGAAQPLGKGLMSEPVADAAGDRSLRELEGIENVVAASAASLRAFADQPGRKVALVASGGWRVDQRAMMGLELPAYVKDGYSLLDPLIDTANLLGYTLYPIHLAEKARLVPSAEPQLASAASGASTMELAAAQNSLVLSARQTGGRLLMPGNNNYLQRVTEDTRSYYWLGFTHTGGDMRRVRLEVQALRPGVEVRSRSSFLPLSRSAKVAMQVESAVLTGDLVGMEPLDVSLGRPVRVSRKALRVPVSLRIPMKDITLLPNGSYQVARLELRTASTDKDGGRSLVAKVPLEIRIQGEAPPADGHLQHDLQLGLRNVPQYVLVSIHDVASGKTLAARVPFEPEK
ncbi:MAG TPA: VWA domain-containing protein [Thermoanaerobaculia bacterium]|nr:VWA domain-containing protein [Thermoanaerobaculia bacterium]